MTTRLTFDQGRFDEALSQLQVNRPELDDLQLAAKVNCSPTTIRSWKKKESKPTLPALMALYQLSEDRRFLPAEFQERRAPEIERLLLNGTQEEVQTRLKRVYDIGAKVGLWDTYPGMVRASGCDFEGSNLKIQLGDTKSSHCSVFIMLEILEAAQRKLRQSRDELLEELSAVEEEQEVSESGNGTARASLSPAIPMGQEENLVIAVSTKHMDKLAAGIRLLLSSLGAEAQLTDTQELKGVVQPTGMTVGGVRFALTSNHFTVLDGDVSDREIEDTLLLMEELRRRWNIFARLNDEIRERVMARLGPEIDELFLTLLANKEQLPANAIEMLEAQREAFAQLAGRNKGGKKR